MKCLQTCSRNLGRKGRLSHLGNDNEAIFRGYVLPDLPESLQDTSVKIDDRLIGLEMPFLIRPYLRSVPMKLL